MTLQKKNTHTRKEMKFRCPGVLERKLDTQSKLYTSQKITITINYTAIKLVQEKENKIHGNYKENTNFKDIYLSASCFV